MITPDPMQMIDRLKKLQKSDIGQEMVAVREASVFQAIIAAHKTVLVTPEDVANHNYALGLIAGLQRDPIEETISALETEARKH